MTKLTAAAPDRPLLPLLEEADRQLKICNACRYCEGFCAVFPALARRTELSSGDVSHLANLCHDCRACFDACMYAPPHEFDINVPRVLSALRVEDYERYLWPERVPGVLRGRRGVFSGAVIAAALVLGIAAAHAGFSGLVASDGQARSPYTLIPYPVLLILLLVPAVYAVAIMALAAWRYWRQAGPPRLPATPAAIAGAVRGTLRDAATLRYQRGGGGDCYYPKDDEPSPARRHLHHAVAYGFGLCVVSTVAAAISQDVAGVSPPYPLLSVPVVTGIAGGIGLVAGCFGLLRLKLASSAVTSFAQMTVKDYGLLVALGFLALSGLATLLVRDTPAFGIVFLIHLSAVMLAFAVAPYSKFVHLIFRFLALLRDNLEAGVKAAVRSG